MITSAIDRYLQQTGRLQHYGTQYVTDLQARFVLCPVAPGIPDEERARWGLPTLAELQARTDDFNGVYEIPPHELAPLGRIPIIGKVVNQGVILWNCLY